MKKQYLIGYYGERYLIVAESCEQAVKIFKDNKEEDWDILNTEYYLASEKYRVIVFTKE